MLQVLRNNMNPYCFYDLVVSFSFLLCIRHPLNVSLLCIFGVLQYSVLCSTFESSSPLYVVPMWNSLERVLNTKNSSFCNRVWLCYGCLSMFILLGVQFLFVFHDNLMLFLSHTQILLPDSMELPVASYMIVPKCPLQASYSFTHKIPSDMRYLHLYLIV